MRITLIGSGNVAAFLGKLLLQNGHSIEQVFSRNISHAQKLAKTLQTEPINDIKFIKHTADIFIVAVSDDVLPTLAAQLSIPHKIIVHTSGAVSKEVLANSSNNYGVIWPLKMIRQHTPLQEPFTMVIDANSDALLLQLRELCQPCSEKIIIANDAVRTQLHMLASFTANFSNHLYKLAADFCVDQQIDFNVFYNIIAQSASAIQQQNPAILQAGPAFRGDEQTIEKHLALLNHYPDMQLLYETITNSILAAYHPSK